MGMADDLRGALAGDSEAGDAAVEDLHRRGWPVEEQVDSVIASYEVHRMGGSRRRQSTDRELHILAELIAAGVLPEHARDYFERIPPDEQPERERFLYEHRDASRALRLRSAAIREHLDSVGYPIPPELCDLERYKGER